MVIQMIHVCGERWLATLMTMNEDPRDHLVVRASFKLDINSKVTEVGLDLEPALNGSMIWFTQKFI
jgi:hypothetical protein